MKLAYADPVYLGQAKRYPEHPESHIFDDLDTRRELLARLDRDYDGWALRIAYTWEAVLFVPGRDSSKLGAPVGRDHLAESITLRKGLTGAKPERFCAWVLDLMGYVPGDTVDDLYPGTGVMGRVLASREAAA